MRVQSNIIMPTSFEHQSQVIRMTHPHTRMSSEVIQKYFDNGLEIMENQGHRPLKSSSDVFKAERHFSIRKCSPRTNKSSLMLVLKFNLNLIISGKPSIKENTSLPVYSSKIWSINGVGKLSLGQARFKSWKSVHIRISPYFLSTRMGFETHSVRGTG